MRGILIDPFKKEVRDVEGDFDDFKVIQAFVADGRADGEHKAPFSSGPRLGNVAGVDLHSYVDDEGLFRPNQAFCHLHGYDHPLAGYVLILGGDYQGNECDVPDEAKPEALAQYVSWISRTTAQQLVQPVTVHTLGPDMMPDKLVSSTPVELAEDSPLPMKR